MMMAGVIQSHLYSRMKGEKRKARSNIGSKNEAEKNNTANLLTRLSGTSGSYEHCDITC